jgi:signal transduction histidine kinase
MYVVLILGYSLNCGIDGPMILVFGITFLILAAIIKESNLLFWLLFHLFIALILLYLEYQHPDFIFVTYEKKSYRFFDMALTLAVLLLTIFLTIKYLKQNYLQQLELSSKKNEELLQANATKNKLFSIISHDLRSPFNALIGLSQILKENSSDLAEAEKEEFVDAIYETSKKTYFLLQNLLEWSLSQTNEIQFTPERINLNEVVKHSLLMPLEVAKAKDIKINTTIDDSYFINVDKNMFETIIRNIVSNAIKFTHSKGLISIAAFQADKGVTIEIKDNGIGMCEATLSTLFTQNGALSHQDIAHERGLGLGLLLCKDFVERHDGKIWAESTAGKGTTFFVFINNGNF